LSDLIEIVSVGRGSCAFWKISKSRAVFHPNIKALESPGK